MAEFDVHVAKPSTPKPYRAAPKPGEMAAAHAEPMAMPNPYAMAPMHFWPPDAIYVRGLQDLILNQVHYYFSTENLVRDQFLRLHMDGEGWIPIVLLASFNRLRTLTTDVAIVTEALAFSPDLEVWEGTHVRKRHDWQRWVFPTSKLSDRSSPVGEASTGETYNVAAVKGHATQGPTGQPSAAPDSSGPPALPPTKPPAQPDAREEPLLMPRTGHSSGREGGAPGKKKTRNRGAAKAAKTAVKLAAVGASHVMLAPEEERSRDLTDLHLTRTSGGSDETSEESVETHIVTDSSSNSGS